MAELLKAPEGFSVTGKDGCASLKWNEVSGAVGYRIFFYKSDEPEKTVKSRYSQRCEKGVLGFTNGTEYLAQVCAYRIKDGKEQCGKRSEKLPFVPMSRKLKAQNTICLNVGESAQIEWEQANTRPEADFSSDNTAVAAVDGRGLVTAKANGSAAVKITAGGQSFVTRIEVGRSQPHGSQRAVLMFTGDLMCAVKHQRTAAKYGYDFHDTFRQVKGLLSGADFAAGVLETSCFDGAPYEHEMLRLPAGSPNCNSPSTFVSAAASAGFDLMVTANNHSCDTGAVGLRATVAEIKRCGMRNAGTLGDNPVFFSVKGFRAAVIACTMISNGTEAGIAEDSGIHCVNPAGSYSRDYFTELINRAKAEGAEYIIAYQHWGCMNSDRVRQSQVQEAQFMADAGADIIIGSHPHMIQRFSWIKSADGRRVPCAYSLGNFLSTMSEMDGNRDGVILRAELRRNDGKIETRVSCIPCMTADRDFGAEVLPVYPAFSAESRSSLERTKAVLGDKINVFSPRPRVFLCGSSLLGRIFRSGTGFRTDRTGLLLSQISLGSKGSAAAEDITEERLRLDIEKDLASAVRRSGADYVAVDFYSAASIACYKLDGEIGGEPCFFTGSKSFKRSAFYKDNKDKFTRINPPFGEMIWKPLVERYAAQLLSAVPGERIILFRHKFGSHMVNHGELRNYTPKASTNRFMTAMEDYFITLVKPLIVDLSEHYFLQEDGVMGFEEGYYLDAYRAAEKLTNGSGRTFVNQPDLDIWFSRVMKYYDNMTARAYQSWLLDMGCAADQIIAHTTAEFAARNSERLLWLKRAGGAELSHVREFFEGDSGAEELCQAADIISVILGGSIDRPYDFFAPAFRGHFNIIRKMVRILSSEIGASVNEDSAELVFLLQGKPQMKRYINALNRMTLDIWGSCVSRESANHSKDAYIGTYIFKQSPILAFEKPVEAEFPENADKFCGNRWRRRTMRDSFLRSGDADIEGSESRWILLDFYDLISRMAEYKGALFEIDDFICRTDFYKEMQPECTECYLFEKRDMKYCFETMTRFAEMILKKYGEHIILIKTEPKDMFIDLDYRLQPLEDDGMFEIKKKFISLCEERFASVTGCYVIDISKHFYSSDSFPLGGAHIVHYEEEFYRQAGEYINEIISGSSRRVFSTVDDNYLLMRNLRLNR
ncbi:MAG: CapA family protein [Oscillospiraceae bacterium]